MWLRLSASVRVSACDSVGSLGDFAAPHDGVEISSKIPRFQPPLSTKGG